MKKRSKNFLGKGPKTCVFGAFGAGQEVVRTTVVLGVMTPDTDISDRKIIQLIAAGKKTVVIFDSNHKESLLESGDDEETVASSSGDEDGEVYVPVELWALVEDNQGKRSILCMSADDILGGHLCTDAVNFLRYVTLQDNR